MAKIRAVIFLPVVYAGAILDELDINWQLHPRVGFESRLRVRSEFSNFIKWEPGYLKKATKSSMPTMPFNQAIGRDLPESLRKFVSPLSSGDDDFWYYRTSTPFFVKPMPSGLPAINVEAIEALQHPMASTSENADGVTVFLLFHLVANDTQANRDAIFNLTKIQNSPVKRLFANFFASPFLDVLPEDQATEGRLINHRDVRREGGYEFDGNWYLSTEFKSTVMAMAIEDDTDEIEFHNSNAITHINGDDRSVTRFRTQFTFLTVLFNLQKERFDYMRRNWGDLSKLEIPELRKAHSDLVYLRNQWWWQRISYDDYMQANYISWRDALNFHDEIEMFERDIQDLLNFAIASQNEREAQEIKSLNKLVKVFAVFGILPAWIALLPPLYDGWLVTLIGVFSAIGILAIPSRSFSRIVDFFARRLE